LAVIALVDLDIVLGAHNVSATKFWVAGILRLERVTDSEELHSMIHNGLLSHQETPVEA